MPEGYVNGKPDVEWWTQQLTAGVRFRQKHAREDRWQRWRAYYRNTWKDDVVTPSALYFKTLRTIVPRVYFRNPSVSIVNNKPGLENMAMGSILERVDNNLLRAMKVKKQVKKMVQSAFMFGTTAGKLGYGAEYALSMGDGDVAAPNVKGEMVEYNSNIRANMPWFMRVPTGNLIVPDGTEDFDDARWMAVTIRRPLSDVRADPRLENASKITSNVVHTDKTNTAGGAGIVKPIEEVDLAEIKDKKTGKIIVLPLNTHTDSVLYFDTDDTSANGRLGLYPVVFNEDDEVCWGIPDSAILEYQQREINEIKSQQTMHRRLTIVRILAEVGAISKDEADKLLSPNVSPVVWVKNLDKAIKVIESGGVPNDLYMAEEAVMQETREMVGFSRNQFGDYKRGSSDTTATEASIVQMASEIRVDERRDMIADMMVDVVTDMHQIVFHQWDAENVIPITGPEGIRLWVRFRGDMLESGQYVVSIDPDSSVPETKGVREQKAVQVYGILKENPLIGQNPQQLGVLTKWLMNEMNNVGLEEVMRGLPSGVGMSAQNPMSVAQLGQAMQNVADNRRSA